MMTNKERYQQAFSALPSSRQFHLEVEEMAMIQKKHQKIWQLQRLSHVQS